ncbi:MAG: hypothetical protein U0Q15_20410 [Kineosporiaceae bacterium]
MAVIPLDDTVPGTRPAPSPWRVAVGLVLTVAVAVACLALLSRGRLEGTTGSEVGISRLGPQDPAAVGMLFVRNGGRSPATIVDVRVTGSDVDRRGVLVGPALLVHAPDSAAFGAGRGWPPTAIPPGKAVPAEGATIAAGSSAELVLRLQVTDGGLHHLDAVEVVYRQSGRTHRVLTGPSIELCPQECPVDEP